MPLLHPASLSDPTLQLEEAPAAPRACQGNIFILSSTGRALSWKGEGLGRGVEKYLVNREIQITHRAFSGQRGKGIFNGKWRLWDWQ